MKRQAIGASIAAVFSAAMGLIETAQAGSYEEPKFTVLSTESDYEVRQYEGWIQAQVTVASSYDSSVQGGFQILAKYIFGGNQAREAIDMTTPVAAVPSDTIDMTSPVSASQEGGLWTVSFMMPKKWTMETLPVPNDPRIELVEIEPTLCVVRTFSGRASQQQADRELGLLLEQIETAGFEVAGPPSIAQFNPPWILGPWRRNEVRVPIHPAS